MRPANMLSASMISLPAGVFAMRLHYRRTLWGPANIRHCLDPIGCAEERSAPQPRGAPPASAHPIDLPLATSKNTIQRGRVDGLVEPGLDLSQGGLLDTCL